MSVTNLVTIRDKTNLFKKNRSFEALNEYDAEQKIISLDQLDPGDHLVLSLDPSKYCHAILEQVYADKNIVQIIYFDDTKTQCSLEDFILKPDGSECHNRFIGVKLDTLQIHLDKISIYKVFYSITESCLPPDECIHKARGYIGQSKYNIFVNNDEHFAIFCKTGKAAKLFIVNPNDVAAKKIIGKNLSQKLVENLAQQGAHVLLVNSAKHVATNFPRGAVTAGLPAVAEAAGSAIGVGVEGVTMGFDLYKAHKNLKEGKVSEIKFKKYIAKRVTRGTMSAAGGVAGGILGQMIIPVPVVGAVIGSIVGGLVGAATGQIEGILIGELIEVMDEKKKEKEKLMQNLEPKFRPGVRYSVIHHLVFKFNKDVFIPENLAQLSQDKENGLVVDNFDSKINDEDYEIFVLNDSNEIVADLNLNDLFDENGCIDKRKSLETFSSTNIPDNINVFFKVLDDTSD
ncbi:MATH and LRR domain-containing protein PFE0570w-like [Brachionus plicatilis]|uniref:MATH and LRR domain-containing protein PFE0570w-like n=1 Tax=Brachionus plicatilis TaxID=10195 RepID=A0A3M7P6U2_BRAPC|nr:MATH and LRR domain-containing protein PFE0570w-like [Brachionus plicatilis]